MWKEVPRVKELSVSNLGGVKINSVVVEPKFVTGYKVIHLNGQMHLIHRLVMEAFVGPCPDNMEVDHLNSIRHDNRLENLEYVTHRENCRRASERDKKSDLPSNIRRTGNAYFACFTVKGDVFYSKSQPTLDDALKQRELMQKGVDDSNNPHQYIEAPVEKDKNLPKYISWDKKYSVYLVKLANNNYVCQENDLDEAVRKRDLAIKGMEESGDKYKYFKAKKDTIVTKNYTWDCVHKKWQSVWIVDDEKITLYSWNEEENIKHAVRVIKRALKYKSKETHINIIRSLRDKLLNKYEPKPLIFNPRAILHKQSGLYSLTVRVQAKTYSYGYYPEDESNKMIELMKESTKALGSYELMLSKAKEIRESYKKHKKNKTVELFWREYEK